MKKELENLKRKVLFCHRCVLYKKRKNPVFGEGSSKAKIMFIGEAPGESEDEKGKPFCGRAGKILGQALERMRLKREKIFITNLLKCRPPKNRPPKKEEIESCVPYLLKQIEIIKPKVICPLGNFSTVFIFSTLGGSAVALRRHSYGASATFARPSQPELLRRSRREGGKKYGLEKKFQTISKFHGKIFRTKKTVIIPFYHPAAVLYQQRLKKIFFKDFKVLKNLR